MNRMMRVSVSNDFTYPSAVLNKIDLTTKSLTLILKINKQITKVNNKKHI